MTTIAQRMSRSERRRMEDAVAQSNYNGGSLFAPISFKADAVDDMAKEVKFEGFANTGRPDLGDDIVDPRAFSKATLQEYLKFGRQLMFMHNPYAQVGEITDAEVVLKGTRSMFGITDGGLKVKGFVDSPIDPDMGWIPDHELAKIIHFARMQVKRNRLKLLSIGWRPTKFEYIKAPDPRRGNEERTFRLVKALILGEISLVTIAMSPQAMIELRKAMGSAYGDEVTDALFCDAATAEEVCNRIPEKVDDFTIDRIRQLVVQAFQKAGPPIGRAPIEIEQTGPDKKASTPGYRIVHLDDRSHMDRKFRIVSL